MKQRGPATPHLTAQRWLPQLWRPSTPTSKRCGWPHRLLVGVLGLTAFFSLPALARDALYITPTARCADGQLATPLTPVDAWLALEDGAQQWYAFRDEGDNTPITVRLTVVPTTGADFLVLTAAQATAWVRGERDQAVGRGTPLAVVNHDLYWTGSFVQSGTYYVLVQSKGQGLSNYQLAINGKRVTYPLLSFAQPALAPPAHHHHCPEDTVAPVSPLPTPTSPAMTTTEMTGSPEQPLPPIGNGMTIAAGERHWYAFRDEGDEATIQLRADATPDNCLTVAIWTSEQLRLWQANEPFQPVGQGTANPTLKADRFWSGSFVKSGTYYVVVDHDRAVTDTCRYTLTVTGDDVSLVQ